MDSERDSKFFEWTLRGWRKVMESRNLGNQFKVHTPNLLKEIMKNQTCAVLRIPLVVFKGILEEVATRASQLNDVEMNKLMMRLTLYEIADPESKEYDREFCNNYLESHVATTNGVERLESKVERLEEGEKG
jgi:hypothetical protein